MSEGSKGRSVKEEEDLRSHLVLHVGETLRHEVEGLVFGDWVLLVAGHEGVEGFQLGFGAQAVLQLSKGGEKACTVGLECGVLFTEAELHCEPVTGGELLDCFF